MLTYYNVVSAVTWDRTDGDWKGCSVLVLVKSYQKSVARSYLRNEGQQHGPG